MAILTNNQYIGKYKVKRLVKESLYFESYLVEDEHAEPYFLKLFVLKKVPSKIIDDDGWLRYINISKQLCHKNIVSFVESGTYHDDEAGDCQYVVTNYCRGEVLADKLQREGELPLETAVLIFQKVLDGLKYLHEKGVLHNDINPRNIMLSEPTGEPMLIDQSHISVFVKAETPIDTSDIDLRYQSLFGRLGYCFYNNDLFAAVGVLYTMLTGRVPWDVTLPENADRKTCLKIVNKAQSVPLPTDGLYVPINIYRILKSGLIIQGTCLYSSVDKLREDMAFRKDKQ